MAVTLCVPPRAGELCAPVRFLLREDTVVMELTARHRIIGVEWDARERAVAMVVVFPSHPLRPPTRVSA